MTSTERLLLRMWQPSDRVAFAALPADDQVPRYFPKALTGTESDAMADRTENDFEEHGFGLWAVEVPGDASCIGFVGLMVPRCTAPFTPSVEVGWRLASEHWGCGYAAEAAQAALQFGPEQFDLEQIVSMTAPANQASRRVMERIGMRCDPQIDFKHSLLLEGAPRSSRVLYRLSCEQWRGTESTPS